MLCFYNSLPWLVIEIHGSKIYFYRNIFLSFYRNIVSRMNKPLWTHSSQDICENYYSYFNYLFF